MTTPVRVRAGALALLALLSWGPGVGCGGAPAAHEATASRSQGLIGGGDDTGASAVVALQITRADGKKGLCTAVVIAPRVVLTAAHCVALTAVGRGASFSVFLGSDLDDAAQVGAAENHVAVQSTVVDPAFDLQLIDRGHDVAVAVLARAVSIAPLAFEPAPSLDGVKSLRVVGYGLSARGSPPTGAGRRRQAEIPLRRFDALLIELGDGPSPCLGDSGGPAFVSAADGSQQLAGIVSFTDASCGPGATLTNLSAYGKFLREQIAAVPAPPADEPPADEPPADEPSSCSVGAASDGVGFWVVVLLLLALARRRRPQRDSARSDRHVTGQRSTGERKAGDERRGYASVSDA